MTILIKNVTNTRANDCAIFELQREGYPEGTIVENVKFTPGNNACYWGDCVAYIGQTCEIISNS